jgi:hypothetical protein
VIAERVSQLLGCRVVSLHQIESRGYAAAYHGVAVLEDGLTVFVKAGTEEVTSGFLRKEIRFYRSFRRRSCLSSTAQTTAIRRSW